MPQYRTVLVVLSAGERRTLKRRARGAKTAHQDWLRAQSRPSAAPCRLDRSSDDKCRVDQNRVDKIYSVNSSDLQ